MPTTVSSLYLHVPYCKHLCNYCDFYKKKFEESSSQIEDFHRFLDLSLSRHEALMNKYNMSYSHLKTLYFGGGTPSLWGEGGAEYFAKNILAKIPMDSDCEFTMEVDPGAWSVEMLMAWKKLGLNRISIGTQTLDPNFIKIMDRAHSLDESHELLKYISDNGWNFSLDFLLGLPYSREKKRDIKTELDALLKYKPKHISLYILNARSKYPHIQNMPDDEFIREEYLFVSEYLKSFGFHHYEVSNFALPGFESKHNLKYWHGDSVAALGPSGTGYFNQGLDQAMRYKWKVMSPEVEIEKLEKKELDLEQTYLHLRLSSGWRPKSLEGDLKCQIRSWEQQGYASFDGEAIKLTSLGFLMLDSLMDDLFRLKSY